jgi:hypothetical protein
VVAEWNLGKQKYYMVAATLTILPRSGV